MSLSKKKISAVKAAITEALSLNNPLIDVFEGENFTAKDFFEKRPEDWSNFQKQICDYTASVSIALEEKIMNIIEGRATK